MSDQCVVGVDLGGTKILTIVYSQQMKKLGSFKQKTKLAAGKQLLLKVIEGIEAALKDAGCREEDVLAIGVAVPGLVHTKNSDLVDLTNLNTHNFNMGEPLRARFHVPVVLENDVNAGTLGEYRFGIKQKAKHVIGLFVGTGVGGGLILNGELYRGAHGAAGEIGHIVIQAGGPASSVGIPGSLEALASKTALAKDMVVLAAAGKAPEVLKEVGTDFAKVKSSLILQSIRKKEEAVIQLVNRSADFLGIGMAACVQIFNPEVILLGGGVVEKLGKTYVERAEKAMQKHSMKNLAKDVQVVSASLGDDAVPMGVASLALEKGKKRG